MKISSDVDDDDVVVAAVGSISSMAALFHKGGKPTIVLNDDDNPRAQSTDPSMSGSRCFENRKRERDIALLGVWRVWCW